MKRTTVFFRQSTLDRLKLLSRKTGIPIAEMIRRATDAFLNKEAPKKKKKAKP